jgi:hypothetical protein
VAPESLVQVSSLEELTLIPDTTKGGIDTMAGARRHETYYHRRHQNVYEIDRFFAPCSLCLFADCERGLRNDRIWSPFLSAMALTCGATTGVRLQGSVV